MHQTQETWYLVLFMTEGLPTNVASDELLQSHTRKLIRSWVYCVYVYHMW